MSTRMETTALWAAALAFAAAPVIAQTAPDASVAEPIAGSEAPAILMPRCAGMMFLIASTETDPNIRQFTIAFVGGTVLEREAAGLPTAEADVRDAVFAYTDAYRAQVDAEAYDLLESDRAFCLAFGLAITNAPE